MAFQESMNSVKESMEEFKKDIKQDIQDFSDSVSQRIEGLYTSFNIDMSIYDSLCQHIIDDLYQAKLSILYDEYNALKLTKELYSFQHYQYLLIESPWYKKFFKFQQKKLKDKAEVEISKSFERKLKEIEQQIQSFTYEKYKKQFEEEKEEKYQAVEDVVNCQHSSFFI